MLARVARERRQGASQDDIPKILKDLDSVIPGDRERAVRQVCPCRMPWDVFVQLRKAVQRLRSDPDPHIREVAFHIEEDALLIEELEALQQQSIEIDDGDAARKESQGRETSRQRRRDLKRQRVVARGR